MFSNMHLTLLGHRTAHTHTHGTHEYTMYIRYGRCRSIKCTRASTQRYLIVQSSPKSFKKKKAMAYSPHNNFFQVVPSRYEGADPFSTEVVYWNRN